MDDSIVIVAKCLELHRCGFGNRSSCILRDVPISICHLVARPPKEASGFMFCRVPSFPSVFWSRSTPLNNKPLYHFPSMQCQVSNRALKATGQAHRPHLVPSNSSHPWQILRRLACSSSVALVESLRARIAEPTNSLPISSAEYLRLASLLP